MMFWETCFSHSETKDVQHVRQVLQLLQSQLFVKVEKCKFHISTVSFLSFILSADKIKIEAVKVEEVKAWPVPGNQKQLQRFLAFANLYCCFMRDYTSIASPLYQLTSTITQVSLNTLLKNHFTSAPVLTLPDPAWQFSIQVDASNYRVGVVLFFPLVLPFSLAASLLRNIIMTSVIKSFWQLRRELSILLWFLPSTKTLNILRPLNAGISVGLCFSVEFISHSHTYLVQADDMSTWTSGIWRSRLFWAKNWHSTSLACSPFVR